MILDRTVQNISGEINILRVGLLQLLCVEKTYAPEAKYEDMNVDTLDEKTLVDIEMVRSFQDKNSFLKGK